ncbi:MAG: hypothetical protein EXS05_11120 [Planctomycetaceae bacterium]|nr:hypothetical protein [Planctomycetaceae bacterium]
MANLRLRSAKQFEIDTRGRPLSPLTKGAQGGASDGVDTAARWLFGILPELALAGYALHAIVTRHTVLIGRGGRLHLHGPEAVSLGIALLALAAFGHFRYFWEEHPKLSAYAEAGNLISLLAMAGGIVFTVIKVLVWN